MRKLFLSMLAVASVCCACGDLKDRVETLEQKVSVLESKVNENASSISALVEAAKKAVTISKVETLADGYKIYFSDGTVSSISNGLNGKDGNNGKDGVDGKDAVAPVVGVKEDGGVLYWTIDGEFLLNAGNKVPVTGKDGVDGKTPKFKIQDDKWYVSFDGNAWEEVPVTGTVKPELVMSETDDEFVFTLGETVISIPKEHAFMIKVAKDVKNVFPGETVKFTYKLYGADETTHVLMECKGVEAVLDEASCTVTVTVPDALENAYIMLKAVRNSDGKYSAQYINVKLGDIYGTFGGIIISDENEYLNW